MKHLTLEQRYTIAQMKQEGYSQVAIAQTIGKPKCTISRELRRNRDNRNGEYRTELAQSKYEKRKKEKPKHIHFTAAIKQQVLLLLKQDYSPEQIVGYLKSNGEECVSHECIYQYIWEDKKKNGQLYTHLRQRGKKHQKRKNTTKSRGVIPNRKSIDERPEIVEEKTRFGDLEVDLIIGRHHKSAIVTLNDRASGMLKMKKVSSKEASVVSEAIIELLQEWKPYIHTITSDNGKEFAYHEKVAKEMEIDYFFAHPYHSWERGANENLNGLIRQYIPKKSDFNDFSDQRIKEIEFQINTRPRKRFNYKSPIFMKDKLLFKTELHL